MRDQLSLRIIVRTIDLGSIGMKTLKANNSYKLAFQLAKSAKERSR